MWGCPEYESYDATTVTPLLPYYDFTNLLATAKKKAPCIIFMDEIDAVGGKRTGKVFGFRGTRFLDFVLPFPPPSSSPPMIPRV